MNSATAPGGPKRPKSSAARRGFEKDQVETYPVEMRAAAHAKLAEAIEAVADDVSEEAAEADESSGPEEIDDSSEPVAEVGDEEAEDFGESRYARKSHHLPSIEADQGSPSTGSGLRNAIIGPHGKRGDGS